MSRELLEEFAERTNLLEMMARNARIMHRIASQSQRGDREDLVKDMIGVIEQHLEAGKAELSALEEEKKRLNIEFKETTAHREGLYRQMCLRRRLAGMLESYDKSQRPQAIRADSYGRDQWKGDLRECSIKDIVTFLVANPKVWKEHRICRVGIILGACCCEESTRNFIREIDGRWQGLDEFGEFWASMVPEMFVCDSCPVKKDIAESRNLARFVELAKMKMHSANCKALTQIGRVPDCSGVSQAEMRSVIFEHGSAFSSRDVADVISAYAHHMFCCVKLTNFVDWMKLRSKDEVSELLSEREKAVVNFTNAFKAVVNGHLSRNDVDKAKKCFDKMLHMRQELEKRGDFNACEFFCLISLDERTQAILSEDTRRKIDKLRELPDCTRMPNDDTAVPCLRRALNPVGHFWEGYKSRPDGIELGSPMDVSRDIEQVLAAQRPRKKLDIDGTLMAYFLHVVYDT